MKQAKQISESRQLGIILALSGGFMDAYSYIQRGKVFANAQTGNMLLLGIHLSQLKFNEAMHYACPVLAFALGIALAEFLHHFHWKKLHWRQACLFIEIIILIQVAFIDTNLLANSLTSFACGIQVQSFRKIQGLSAATTMCIGNLRSGTHHLCNYFFSKKKDKTYLENGLFYYLIILCFIIGAILGNVFISFLHYYAILGSAGLLIIAFLMMFIDLEKNKLQS